MWSIFMSDRDIDQAVDAVSLQIHDSTLGVNSAFGTNTDSEENDDA
jgi:hypothetical protein